MKRENHNYDYINTNYNTMLFEELVHELEVTYLHIYRKYANTMEYEDVRQELMIKTLEVITKYDESKGAKFTTFLYLLLKNRAIDLIRQHNIYRSRNLPLEENFEIMDYTTMFNQDRHEKLSILDALMEDIQAADRLFIKAYLAANSVADLASKLDMGVSTAYRRLKQIKDQLHESYQRYINK